MFIVRDIFHLKFGHFKDVKPLLEEAKNKGMLPDAQSLRALTDFTGDAYRLIMEAGFGSLADYEKSLAGSMNQEMWQKWYERFKPHIERSHREILKVLE